MYSSMHSGAPALKAHVKSVQQNKVMLDKKTPQQLIDEQDYSLT